MDALPNDAASSIPKHKRKKESHQEEKGRLAMQPNGAPALTDQQIDEWIDQQKIQLRTCYRAVLAQGQPWATLKIGSIKLPSGQPWDVVLFLANEPVAKLIEGVIGPGYVGMTQAFQKMVAQQRPAQPAAGPSTSNPFGLPLP